MSGCLCHIYVCDHRDRALLRGHVAPCPMFVDPIPRDLRFDELIALRAELAKATEERDSRAAELAAVERERDEGRGEAKVAHLAAEFRAGELVAVKKERDAAVQRAERAEADERAAAVWWLQRELTDRVGKHTDYMRGMRSAFRIAAAEMQLGHHRADWDEHHESGAWRGKAAP